MPASAGSGFSPKRSWEHREVRVFRMTTGLRWLLATAVFGLLASTAAATPSISITSPPFGQPLYDVHPTITIEYSANGGPELDLGTLTVLVNGVDWTARFAPPGVSSASYTVAPPESLVAGQLTIAASIRDDDGNLAQTSSQYEVFPTLLGRTPDSGFEGTLVTLNVQGLDPDPANNLVEFTSRSAPTITANPASETGTVKVPLGAVTGPLFVKVNGKASRETLPFTVGREFTYCGAVEKMISRIDGSMLVHYYRWGRLPTCPTIPANHSTTITIQGSDGSVLVTKSFVSEPLTNIAVAKNGLDYAILSNEGAAPAHQVRIYYSSGGEVVVPGQHLATLYSSVADFDVAGNLYFLAEGGPRLVKVHSDGTPSVVTDLQLGESSWANTLGITCGGKVYIDILSHLGSGVYRSDIRLLDLATGQNIGSIPITRTGATGALAYDMTLTGIEDHVLGTNMTDLNANDVEWWRSEGGNPTGTILFVTDPPQTNAKLTVAPDGEVYTTYKGPAPQREVYFARLGYGVPPDPTTGRVQPYCPCPVPDCSLAIHPTTTRWKPQRDTGNPGQPVYIRFTSPTPLKRATVTITGPSPVPPIPPVDFDPANPPPVYEVTWAGPWITNPNDPRSFLASGEYTISIVGVKEDDSTVQSHPYDPNRIVSLVEVTGVRLGSIPGGAVLSDNPPVGPVPNQTPPQTRPGGGKRVFAEAEERTGSVKQRVLVTATTFPRVPDFRGQTPIKVYLRSLDVDDPAVSMLPDHDGDTGPVADNRGTPATGVLVYPTNDPWVVVPEGGDTAEARFDTTLQPGDNFRIVASTSDLWRNDLVAYQPSLDGEIRHADGTALDQSERASVSEMLTVWRTLHLEVDSTLPPPVDPGLPERNFLRGSVTSIGGLNANLKPTQLVLLPAATSPPLALADASPNLSTPGDDWHGRFENGTIRIGIAPGVLEIQDLVGNEQDYVLTRPEGFDLPFFYYDSPMGIPTAGLVRLWDGLSRVFTLDTPVPPLVSDPGEPNGRNGPKIVIAGTTWNVIGVSANGLQVTVDGSHSPAFHLVDDDSTVHPFIPDLTLLTADNDDPTENVFAQAYIWVKYDLPTTGRTAPFVRNVQNDLANGNTYKQQLNLGRDATTSSLPWFWSGYIQGAYQEDEFQAVFVPQPPTTYYFTDGDGDLENTRGIAFGVTPGLSDAHGSLVFTEGVRDFATYVTQVPPPFPCPGMSAGAFAPLVTAHEVAHQFGVEHSQRKIAGGLMREAPCCNAPPPPAQQCDPIGDYFTGADLDKIRQR